MSISRKAIHLVVVTALAGTSGAVLAAQAGKDKAAKGTDTTVSSAQNELIKGSNLIGATVKNQAGDDLGLVADLAIDRSGRISHLVIESTQATTAGKQLTAVPWKAAKPKTEAQALIIDISKDRFASAPQIASDEWQQLTARSDWQSKANSHFGVGQRAAADDIPQSQAWAKSTEARDEEGSSLPSFATMDTDQDGKVTQAEALRYERIENNFARIDSNGDGSIDETEFSAFEAEWTGPESSPMESITDGEADEESASQ